jgi:ABC-type bacteriocin/lantibiotic exporter with double-glycine peptidase domain
VRKKLNNSRQLGKQTSEKSMQFLQEALTGFIESNTYGKNNFFIDRYGQFQSRLNKFLAQRIVIQNLPSRMIEVFAVFGLFVLVVINYLRSGDPTVQWVTVGALMISAYKIIPGIVKIINMAGQIRTYSFTTEGLSSSSNRKVDSPAVTRIESVEFENVVFSYGDKNILKDFSLSVSSGEMVGIVGLSGRGKTTLINLLLGFLEADSGGVRLNGRLSNSQERKAAWPRIAYVKQHIFLLHASIAANITFQETGYDVHKLDKILYSTGLKKTVDSLPQGLQTIVTENGKNFSGGQRQRIVFARCLYKDADLMILDEPFNELDKASETHMLLYLQNWVAEGKMVLLITHDKAAIEYCSKKYFLDEA